VRIGSWVAASAVVAIAAAIAWVGAQRRLPSPIARHLGPPVVAGDLTLTPVLFATNGYYLFPATTRAEEGRLVVPQNRARSSGPSVDLHFVRFEATTNDPGTTTIYLAGGPGASATLSAAGGRFDFFMRLRQAGDVIVLDQRGTAFSPPALQCSGKYSFPLDQEATVAARVPIIAAHIRECAREFAGEADLAAFNTRESALDIDDLRIALGLDRVNLVAISYGTQLALEYMRLFPDRVASAVLVGTEAPHQVYKLPSRIDAAFDRIAAAVNASGRATDFRAEVAELLANVEAAPVTVLMNVPERVEVVLGRLDVESWLYALMSERESIASLPRWVTLMSQGDFRELARLAASARRGNSVSLMSIAMDCSAGVAPARLEQIDAEAATALLGDLANTPLRAACSAWIAPPLGDDFRDAVESDVVTLFISGTLDARTPLENAEEVMAGFQNATHLVIEGAAHDEDLLISSPRIAELIVAFLRGESLPIDRLTLPRIGFQAP
jgi:pimeloyl-ACP methyl ester carboxylesterase